MCYRVQGLASASGTVQTVREHTEDWMDRPVLRDVSEAVYVFKPARVGRGV